MVHCFITEHSLHWEALEVHNLYQLLHATALHAPDDVSGALVTALPLMHPAGMGNATYVFPSLIMLTFICTCICRAC